MLYIYHNYYVVLYVNRIYYLKSSKIVKLLLGYTLVNEFVGREGFNIQQYNKGNYSLFLKQARGENIPALVSEKEILIWLAQHFQNTPLVKRFENDGDVYSLIITAVPGEQAQRMKTAFTKKEIIKLAALALNRLHNTDLSTFPKTQNILDAELDNISSDIAQGRINIDEFTKATNSTPIAALQKLQNQFASLDQTALTHGDYCLPNILITPEKLVSLIDWTKGGISDIHRDFSAIEGSIARNFGQEFIPFFYQAYGIEPQKVDRNKIEFFNLIDQFFYHRIPTQPIT